MARRKSVYSVKEAAELAFKEMPLEFHVLSLTKRAKEVTNRPDLMDGTILRKLRELRADDTLNYIVINKDKSIYKKTEPQTLKTA